MWQCDEDTEASPGSPGCSGKRHKPAEVCCCLYGCIYVIPIWYLSHLDSRGAWNQHTGDLLWCAISGSWKGAEIKVFLQARLTRSTGLEGLHVSYLSLWKQFWKSTAACTAFRPANQSGSWSKEIRLCLGKWDAVLLLTLMSEALGSFFEKGNH